MGRSALILCFTAFLLISIPQKSFAEVTTYKARIEVDICPEYLYENINIVLRYSIEGDYTLYTPVILEEEINEQLLTAAYTIELPYNYLAKPIHVFAYCQSQTKESEPSNMATVSQCDALALIDSDNDGLSNKEEDTNCDTFFSPGDKSNPFNVDTDGDGVRDLVEVVMNTNPTNPGDSPRPFIYSSDSFDPDMDGNSNPVIWRGSEGKFYIKDYEYPDNTLIIPFGNTGDIPFTYKSPYASSDVGVISLEGTQLVWNFHGIGFLRSDFTTEKSIRFGIFGDNIVLGPWESSGETNPAVARLFNGYWQFSIYQTDGSIRTEYWGVNGDLPRVSDYDGDGRFDLAVFRPSEQKTYIVLSSTNQAVIYNFGSGTADHTVRGDYTGDGIDDIVYWEPSTGTFHIMKSDNGFDDILANEKQTDYYSEFQLGTYFIHLPINYNRQHNHNVFTVIEHDSGYRYYYPNNDPTAPLQAIQWGIKGDSQG